MAKKTIKVESIDLAKKERNLEFQRNIKAGYIMRKLHKEQGTYDFFVHFLEPHLSKEERRLFGLFF